MNYYGVIFVLALLLLTSGCTDADLNPAGTHMQEGTATATIEATIPPVIPGQDPIIGAWRISNSQGYDNRYRFYADGTFAESFYDTKSAVTQVHSGTWSAQGADNYKVLDSATGVPATWIYDPAKRTIHAAAVPHLLLTPYAGDVAPGVVFTTVIPTKTAAAATTAATAVPTTADTSSAPALPSPITLNGVGSKMVYFEAKHPGDVKFKIYYNLSEGEDLKCIDDVTRFRLAGPTIDSTLYYGKVDKLHDAVHTFRLPVPGKYSITVTGCWGWNILVDNA
jgi:hypothetical protein